MHSRLIRCIVLAALCLLGFGGSPARADEAKKPDAKKVPTDPPAPRTTQQAVEKAIAFMEKDAVKWRAERGCATCHHGTMTVWALSEAKNQGYSIDVKALADTTEWTKDQFVAWFSKPRDKRPGW